MGLAFNFCNFNCLFWTDNSSLLF